MRRLRLSVCIAAACMLAGCATSMRQAAPRPPGGGLIDTSPPPAATSQPVANVATQGQIAASVVSQLRSDIEAELVGLQFNRTVDHALDGGQLLVLLSVIWASHRRGMMRIKNDAKRAGT